MNLIRWESFVSSLLVPLKRKDRTNGMVHVNILFEPLRDIVQNNDRFIGHTEQHQISPNMLQIMSNKLV